MPELTILIATGTEAQHTAADGNYALGQLSFTSDGKRLRAGDDAEEGTALIVGQTGIAAIIVPVAAGTTEIVVASGHRKHVRKIAPTAGAGGAFTRKIVLPASEDGDVAVIDGDELIVRCEMPASENPTLEFRNDTDAGTVLLSLPSSATARKWRADFMRYNGAWELWGIAELLTA